jgi:hypothetical protein
MIGSRINGLETAFVNQLAQATSLKNRLTDVVKVSSERVVSPNPAFLQHVTAKLERSRQFRLRARIRFC